MRTTTISLRNPYATHAANRRAGAHRHRAAGRGGVRNESRDLLTEFYTEEDEAAEADRRAMWAHQPLDEECPCCPSP